MLVSDFGGYIYSKKRLKAIGAITSKKFFSNFEKDSLDNGGYFHQNATKYNFFKYPDAYAQVDNYNYNGEYFSWQNESLKIAGNYENNIRIGLWENRAIVEDSISVIMYRDNYIEDKDTLFQERVLLHWNLNPVINIYYKGNRPYYAK